MLPTRDGVSPSCVSLPDGPWATALDFLSERMPNVPRSEWVERMGHGEVLGLHGEPISPDAPYQAHSKLYYYRKLSFEHPIPFDAAVVYQDERLVVADKPHFLPVIPTGRYVQETLLVRLKRQLNIATLVPAHRIDRETAGLVMFTVQPHTRDAYQRLFRDRSVTKVYDAIAPFDARLPFPMTRRSRLEKSEHFMAMREAEGEPNAETHITLVRVLGHADDPARRAHYQLRPLTGQKHQLRVHMNALGLPIVGDRIYPKLQADLAPESMPDYRCPLQLLAQHMSFIDPFTGQLRVFNSRLQLSGQIGH